jgi:hypothetical protein
MPNWVTNHLVITGDDESLNELVTQMRQPYQRPGEDDMVEGEFLLWNAIRPLDMDTYLDQPSFVKPDKPDTETNEHVDIAQAVTEFLSNDLTNLFEEFNQAVATQNDWYHWNLRNWGTKWELRDADLVASETRLSYCFDSAWSPPCEAIDNLAKQYPTLAFSMRFIDEGGGFCGETMWNNGNRAAEVELAVNHDTMTELWGYCTICNSEDPTDDPNERIEYGCPDA